MSGAQQSKETFSVLCGSGKVTEYTREGHREDQRRLKIKEKKEVRRGTLDGTIAEVEEFHTVQDIPRGDAWFLLQALADYYNMELEEQA